MYIYIICSYSLNTLILYVCDIDHTDCCPQLNASYVRDHYLYRASSLNKNRLYAKARKDDHTNGDCSTTPTIYPLGMNTQGGFCDLAISALKKIRDLQAKVIKTAAFCHNRALRDLYPNSYQLLFTTGSITLSASPFSSEPDV
jgi:hypothetical protein